MSIKIDKLEYINFSDKENNVKDIRPNNILSDVFNFCVTCDKREQKQYVQFLIYVLSCPQLLRVQI